MTKKELKQLRKEIVLNSIFIKDYSNSFGIDPEKVCNFFDGYLEDLSDKYNTRDLDIILKHDNIANLWSYYNCFCFDPLA